MRYDDFLTAYNQQAAAAADPLASLSQFFPAQALAQMTLGMAKRAQDTGAAMDQMMGPPPPLPGQAQAQRVKSEIEAAGGPPVSDDPSGMGYVLPEAPPMAPPISLDEMDDFAWDQISGDPRFAGGFQKEGDAPTFFYNETPDAMMPQPPAHAGGQPLPMAELMNLVKGGMGGAPDATGIEAALRGRGINPSAFGGRGGIQIPGQRGQFSDMGFSQGAPAEMPPDIDPQLASALMNIGADFRAPEPVPAKEVPLAGNEVLLGPQDAMLTGLAGLTPPSKALMDMMKPPKSNREWREFDGKLVEYDPDTSEVRTLMEASPETEEEKWQILSGPDGKISRVNPAKGVVEVLQEGQPEPEEIEIPTTPISIKDGDAATQIEIPNSIVALGKPGTEAGNAKFQEALNDLSRASGSPERLAEVLDSYLDGFGWSDEYMTGIAYYFYLNGGVDALGKYKSRYNNNAKAMKRLLPIKNALENLVPTVTQPTSQKSGLLAGMYEADEDGG